MGLTVKELRTALRELADDCQVILSVEDDNPPVPIIHETEAIGAIVGPGVIKILGTMHYR
jgi:hypothetical protein